MIDAGMLVATALLLGEASSGHVPDCIFCVEINYGTSEEVTTMEGEIIKKYRSCRSYNTSMWELHARISQCMPRTESSINVWSNRREANLFLYYIMQSHATSCDSIGMLSCMHVMGEMHICNVKTLEVASYTQCHARSSPICRTWSLTKYYEISATAAFVS